MFETTATTRGPIFDGRARRAMDDYLETAAESVGQIGQNEMQDATVVFKNPSGHYRSSLVTERRGDDVLITDGHIVYGPWLEGTGSRNRTSRFKGYHLFRQVAQRLDGRAGRIAQAVLPPFLRRMQ